MKFGRKAEPVTQIKMVNGNPIDTKKITIGRSDGKVIKFNGK